VSVSPVSKIANNQDNPKITRGGASLALAVLFNLRVLFRNSHQGIFWSAEMERQFPAIAIPYKERNFSVSNHYQNNPGWRFADPGLFYLTPSGYCSGIPIRAFFGVLKWSGNSRQLQFPTKSGILALF